jgi:hypothetical protein
MFGLSKTYLGVGVVMGMAAGAAVVSAMVMACPEGRCMARRMMRKGKRMVHHYMPMAEKYL